MPAFSISVWSTSHRTRRGIPPPYGGSRGARPAASLTWLNTSPSIQGVNERLRTVMLQRGYTPSRLARACGINSKTVERWITTDRVPHRETRWTVAHELDTDEVYLWPGLLEDRSDSDRQESIHSELVRVYPDRSSVP